MLGIRHWRKSIWKHTQKNVMKQWSWRRNGKEKQINRGEEMETEQGEGKTERREGIFYIIFFWFVHTLLLWRMYNIIEKNNLWFTLARKKHSPPAHCSMQGSKWYPATKQRGKNTRHKQSQTIRTDGNGGREKHLHNHTQTKPCSFRSPCAWFTLHPGCSYPLLNKSNSSSWVG